ncbi:MAG: hypothetical protein AVDCRST_MAG05-3120, partial [uncultured Rubrobacteraceae bacterium]
GLLAGEPGPPRRRPARAVGGLPGRGDEVVYGLAGPVVHDDPRRAAYLVRVV